PPDVEDLVGEQAGDDGRAGTDDLPPDVHVTPSCGLAGSNLAPALWRCTPPPRGRGRGFGAPGRNGVGSSQTTGKHRMVLRVRQDRRPSNLLRLAPAKEVGTSLRAVSAPDPSLCPRRIMTTNRYLATAAALATTLALGACSATGGGPTAPEGDGRTLRVVTHDSFHLDEELLADFEERTGYTIEHVTPGDAGALANLLVLTRDNPLGDVVYGIATYYASCDAAEVALVPYRSRPVA